MIKTFEDLSETSFSQSICYFKSIGNMTTHFSYIFIFIIVKTIVIYSIWSYWGSFLSFSFVYINCFSVLRPSYSSFELNSFFLFSNSRSSLSLIYYSSISIFFLLIYLFFSYSYLSDGLMSLNIIF